MPTGIVNRLVFIILSLYLLFQIPFTQYSDDK